MSLENRKKAYIDKLSEIQDSISFLFNYWLTEERQDAIEKCIEIVEEMKDEEFQYREDDENEIS